MHVHEQMLPTGASGVLGARVTGQLRAAGREVTGRAVVAAIEGGRAGQVYNIVDDTPLGFGAQIRAAAAAFGAPAPVTVPLRLLRLAPLAHSIMSTDLRLSNAKAKAELGWQPTRASSVDGLNALAAATAGRPAA